MVLKDESTRNSLVAFESRGLTKRSSALVRRALDSAITQKKLSNSIGMEFVWIRAGQFLMGSSSGNENEQPVHQVTFDQGFFMGKYAVTEQQWHSMVGKRGIIVPPKNLIVPPKIWPAERVSWNDAQEFIDKLNELNDGYKYRMPSESEWEYACRAGTTGDYAGDLESMAWYYENSGEMRFSDEWSRGKLKENNNVPDPVGIKRPNHFGLFDMHGNVWEWCEDWYHETYMGAPSDGSAWVSGGEQKKRVMRGGSWVVNASKLRSAFRGYSTPVNRSDGYGFRLVAVERTP